MYGAGRLHKGTPSTQRWRASAEPNPLRVPSFTRPPWQPTLARAPINPNIERKRAAVSESRYLIGLPISAFDVRPPGLAGPSRDPLCHHRA